MKTAPQYIEINFCPCSIDKDSERARYSVKGCSSNKTCDDENAYIGINVSDHIHDHINESGNIEAELNGVKNLSATAVEQGRYSGADRYADIEVRVDQELGILSGDIFRRDEGDGTWVASFRTAPGEELKADRRLGIVAVDRHNQTALGFIELTKSSSGPRAALRFEGRLDSLPFRREFGFYLSKTGDRLRRLGIELELEHGVAPPTTAVVDGVEYSFESVMAKAGIDIDSVGQSNILPPPPDDGWSEKSLETIMHDLAQSDTDRPGFDLRMLWISQMNRPRVLGVMFDIEGELQRQGFAVCQTALDNRTDIPDARRPVKTLQTAVHEAGHALNLAHRFEREVGRSDSLSPMNYDWKFQGGGKVDAFWRDFRFDFDRDELAFMRHGSYRDVVPGGASFHSVRYWADGDGGYSSYAPEVPLHGWDLKLLPPINPVLNFAQPVTVGLELTNMTGRPQRVPGFLLDQKAGFVQFMIEREGGTPEHFHSLTHRCFDLGASDEEVVLQSNGNPLIDNANLTFGTSGFPFAEPGNYRIKAVLSIYREDNSGNPFEQITVSNEIRVRVSMPQTREEEKDALVLLQSHIGQYFVYGGLDRLSEAEHILLEIAERRDRTKSGVVRDPIAAHIHRCAGFNANRSYLRHIEGEFRRREAEPERAMSHFDRIDAESLKCVDPITRKETLKHIAGMK